MTETTWAVLGLIVLLGAVLKAVGQIAHTLAELLKEVKNFRVDYLAELDRLYERSSGPVTGQLDDIKDEITGIKDVIENVVSAAKQRNAG